MIEYYCTKCNHLLDVTYKKMKKNRDARQEYPEGKCPKCKTVYSDLDHEIDNHLTYRDNLRHCPNCGKAFRTEYGARTREQAGAGIGWELQYHQCPRCNWHIGWQHTFSHGEYLVAMESMELWGQRLDFWKNLGKYGLSDESGH
jgi:phage FluMu protein Com